MPAPFLLDHRLIFPPANLARRDGLLAVGGDLSSERIILAYQQGIFPWYELGQPILWWSPNPRMVIWAENLRLTRSLTKTLRHKNYEIRVDTAFSAVIAACADTPRGEDAPPPHHTWITEEMQLAYGDLHRLGMAHSVEVWRDERLIGGLYGIQIGLMFFGESMFHRERDASKIAFAHLVRWMAQQGISLIDCQVYSEHLESLGATLLPRAQYLSEIAHRCQQPHRLQAYSALSF